MRTIDATRLLHLETVPRWAIARTIQQQNVASHSYNVAVITAWLVARHAERKQWKFTSACLMHALSHDQVEALTGDIAGPTKHLFKTGEKALVERHNMPEPVGPSVRNVVKVADTLESVIFLRREICMGNSNPGVESAIHGLRSSLTEEWESFEWGHENPKPHASDLELMLYPESHMFVNPEVYVK